MPANEQDQPSQTPAVGEPRKKRAKIVSACGECRRKKTKCNGEQPCRNCLKSNVPCVYPAASHHAQDDKRGSPSKLALEAIEDRLKAIEDMLRMILESHNVPGAADLDPVAVSQYLNARPSVSTPTRSSSSSRHSPPPHSHRYAHSHRSPPLASTSSSPPYRRSASPPHYSAMHDVRLPSIHNLSVHPSYRTRDSSPSHDLPHPHSLQNYHLHSSQQPLPPTAGSGRPQPSETEDYV